MFVFDVLLFLNANQVVIFVFENCLFRINYSEYDIEAACF